MVLIDAFAKSSIMTSYIDKQFYQFFFNNWSFVKVAEYFIKQACIGGR